MSIYLKIRKGAKIRPDMKTGENRPKHFSIKQFLQTHLILHNIHIVLAIFNFRMFSVEIDCITVLNQYTSYSNEFNLQVFRIFLPNRSSQPPPMTFSNRLFHSKIFGRKQ